MKKEETEITKVVYAVVEDTLTQRCVVKTLWNNKKDAKRYAKQNKLRVVEWGVLRKLKEAKS